MGLSLAGGDGAPLFEEAAGPFPCVAALVRLGVEVPGKPAAWALIPREPVFAGVGMQFESHVFSLFRGMWAAACVQISFYGPCGAHICWCLVGARMQVHPAAKPSILASHSR